MSLTTRHYVTFSVSGIFVDHLYTMEIHHRNQENMAIPDGINSYYFFDVDVAETPDGTRLYSQKKNISPTFYVDACTITPDELVHEVPDVYPLLGAVHADGGQQIVRMRSGDFQVMKCDDVLI